MRVRLLLHRFLWEESEVELLPTSPQLLRAASFIDGRSDFSCGTPEKMKLRAFLRSEADPGPPDRMIFHSAFCGSSLLARLLDVPGASLVLREPNCLADLANRQAAADRQGKRIEGFEEVVAATCRHLSRSWAAGEAVVVKPSNWVNNLLPALQGPRLRPLFLTASRRRFLTAVFRGGSERLAFTARAAVHLSSAGEEAAKLVAKAITADTDQLRQLARLAVATHEIQLRQFHAAADLGHWGAAHWLDGEELLNNTGAAVGKAATALQLALSAEAIDINIERWASSNAKSPELGFSAEEEAKANAAVEARHGDCIAHALDWASGEIGH